MFYINFSCIIYGRILYTKGKNMLIGYARVSKSDDSQSLNLQIDALMKEGIEKEYIYTDKISAVKDKRLGLESCLKSLRKGDILIVWKLDRLGRNLKNLIEIIDDLNQREVAFRVLTGQGINLDTTSASGKMIFSIFGAFAEFERELNKERTIAGLKAARARGRKGGRQFKLTKSQVRLAEASMKNRDTSITELCKELKITKPTLYRYVGPNGEIREFGKRVLTKP